MQLTMLATLLLELYLQRLVYLPDSSSTAAAHDLDERQFVALLQEREDLDTKVRVRCARPSGFLMLSPQNVKTSYPP